VLRSDAFCLVRVVAAFVVTFGLTACPSDQRSSSAAAPSAGAAPSADAARVLFVGPDGDDSGTGAQDGPLRTIAAAAARARAGDIVMIRPGTYMEAVLVAGEGTRERPIIFAAEIPGTVVFAGEDAGFAPLHWAGDDDVLTQSGNGWVTLRGLIFRQIGDRPAVRAATGWRIEGSLFEKLSIGVNVRGHDVVVIRSVFRDIDSPRAHALVAFGSHNLTLSNLVIQRVNTRRLIEDISNSAVFKVLASNNLLIEKSVIKDNVGPGLWLDSDNQNFVIRHNYISGNQGDRHAWEGPGMWIENNPSANGRIYDNVITGNMSAALELMESSDVAVHDNTLLGNAACIGLRNLERGVDNDGLHDIQIRDNLCGNWSSAGIATGIGDWVDWDAASRGIEIDGNFYLNDRGAPIFIWLGSEVTTLDEAAAKLGFEANGVALPAVSGPAVAPQAR
jgi:Right handed beta helix region/Chondroitinase B